MAAQYSWKASHTTTQSCPSAGQPSHSWATRERCLPCRRHTRQEAQSMAYEMGQLLGQQSLDSCFPAGPDTDCCCAQVAPITDVAFNNLVCAQLPLQPLGGSPAAAPSAMPEQIAEPGNNTLTKPSPLYVEYAPVVYLQNQQQSGSSWQSDINSLITFLVRCDNSLYY